MDIFSLTHEELTQCFNKKYGKGFFHSTAVYREIIKKGNLDFHCSEEFNKSAELAEKISRDLIIPIPEISHRITEGNILKFLCKFQDGLESESVIISMQKHNTLCISSQIGCRFGCRFCETGRMGFRRNLSVSEIVGQVYIARFVLKKNFKNLVFMGMGEPFDNFDHVKKSIDVLNDQRGFDFAHSHITISTSGLTEGIQKLAALNWRRINLAVSLNAPNNTIRSELMPINRTHSMEDLKAALLAYPLRKNGSFFMEYVLIRHVNDSESHADQLADYLRPLKVRLNLIPLNRTSGYADYETSDEEVHRFAKLLEDRHIFVRKRWSKGGSLSAGCGQLGKSSIKKTHSLI